MWNMEKLTERLYAAIIHMGANITYIKRKYAKKLHMREIVFIIAYGKKCKFLAM